ncbi:MAG: DUF2764 family protein [Candidatus Anammoximicrobium sp.]|nr:DUF2764 family protein [Candidatus Anammoximicrobium sp.]
MLDHYYYLASLPALDGLGSEPGMGFAELLEHVENDRPRHELVGCLFLLDDLLQREGYLAGELEQVDPAVLSIHQVRNESPLPEYLILASEPDETSRLGAADRLWEAYFRYVAAAAQRLESRFLAAWVGHEVALRNALVSARAKRLGLEEADYLVAADLASAGEEVTTAVSEWALAPTPLAGQQALLRARWTWLTAHDAWFTFSNDELAVYAARLLLLHQWLRMTSEGGQEDTAFAGPAGSARSRGEE